MDNRVLTIYYVLPYYHDDFLQIYLDSLDPHEDVPYAAIAYLAGECNYGGRVTDDKDRICLNTILDRFYSHAFLTDDHKITPSGLYTVPVDGGIEDYRKYVESLPIVAPPEVFGLDDNATLTKDQNETSALFSTSKLNSYCLC